MKWPEELRSYWILDITNGHTIKIKANTAIERYYISPNGKKIISLSQELVRVENSFNDEGAIAWPFKKPLSNVPYIGSFSKDNSLFSVVSKGKQLLLFLM